MCLVVTCFLPRSSRRSLNKAYTEVRIGTSNMIEGTFVAKSKMSKNITVTRVTAVFLDSQSEMDLIEGL